MKKYTYKIVDLHRNSEDIICTATYTITASEGKYENTHAFHTAFAPPKNAAQAVTKLAPFKNVSEAQVIKWIKAMFDTIDEEGNPKNDNEEQAAAELEAAVRYQKFNSNLPWT